MRYIYIYIYMNVYVSQLKAIIVCIIQIPNIAALLMQYAAVITCQFLISNQFAEL